MKPILFSTDMVQAILEGRKTQSRRITKPQPTHIDCGNIPFIQTAIDDIREVKCPYVSDDRKLWVRETWKTEELESGLDGIRYKADNDFLPIENTTKAADLWGRANTHCNIWRPSIHMPRWAARIFLEIIDIRIERVQDIIVQDCIAEGIKVNENNIYSRITKISIDSTGKCLDDFEKLWNSINKKPGHTWKDNPYVWIVEFKKTNQPKEPIK